MASDSGSTLHLDDVKTMHDLVMVKFAESGTVNNFSFVDLTPSPNNFVQGFVFSDNDVFVDNVSNCSEFLVQLSDGDFGDLVLFSDPKVKRL